MDAGALALTFGWSPVEFANLDTLQRMYARACLNRAQDLRAEWENARIDALSVRIGNTIGQVLGG